MFLRMFLYIFLYIFCLNVFRKCDSFAKAKIVKAGLRSRQEILLTPTPSLGKSYRLRLRIEVSTDSRVDKDFSIFRPK